MKLKTKKALAFVLGSTLMLGMGSVVHAADDTKSKAPSSTPPDQPPKEKSGSVGQFVDDATITTRVKSRFASDNTVSATRIKVDTVKGIVELSGQVATEAERDQAVTIARGVPDVRGVRNNLTIQGSANKATKSDATSRTPPAP